MRWFKPKNLTACMTAFVFFVTGLGIPPFIPDATAAPNVSASPIGDPGKLNIPRELGTVTRFFRGSAPETVILIQDAHAIPEAQKKIQEIISYFQKQHAVRIIGLEGTTGALDPQIFRSFPDKKQLTEIFDHYRDQGELPGGPAAAIFSDRQDDRTIGREDETNRNHFVRPFVLSSSCPFMQFSGVENWPLYEQGFRLFNQAMAEEPKIREALNVKREALEKEKQQIYSPELLKIDQALEKFYEDQSQILEILKTLATVMPPDPGTQLTAIYEKSKAETSEALEVEVKKMAIQVEKHLKEVRQSKLEVGKKDFSSNFQPPTSPPKNGRIRPLADNFLKQFNEQLQKYRTSEITAEAFALYLRELAAKYQIPLKVSSPLSKSAALEKKIRDIKGTKLFDEFEEYTEQVITQMGDGTRLPARQGREMGDKKSNLSLADLQSAISNLQSKTKQLRLLNSLAKLELTHKQWEEIKLQTLDPRPKTIDQNRASESRTLINKFDSHLSFSEQDPNLWSLVFGLLSTHVSFYVNAERRDSAIVENLQKLLHGAERMAHGVKNQHNSRSSLSALRSALLVTGGFHTEGLTQKLKNLDISYALIMPQISQMPEANHYLDHMKGNVSWKEYLRVEDGKIKPYDAFVRAARDRLLARNDRGLDTRIHADQDPRKSVSQSATDPRLAKQWRDQLIRDLSAQHRITEAGRYTRFLDELAEDQEKNKLRSQWQANIEKFIDQLKVFQAQGKLDAPNIAGALKSFTMPDAYTANLLSQSAGLRVNEFTGTRDLQTRLLADSQTEKNGRAEIRRGEVLLSDESSTLLEKLKQQTKVKKMRAKLSRIYEKKLFSLIRLTDNPESIRELFFEDGGLLDQWTLNDDLERQLQMADDEIESLLDRTPSIIRITFERDIDRAVESNLSIFSFDEIKDQLAPLIWQFINDNFAVTEAEVRRYLDNQYPSRERFMDLVNEQGLILNMDRGSSTILWDTGDEWFNLEAEKIQKNSLKQIESHVRVKEFQFENSVSKEIQAVIYDLWQIAFDPYHPKLREASAKLSELMSDLSDQALPDDESGRLCAMLQLTLSPAFLPQEHDFFNEVEELVERVYERPKAKAAYLQELERRKISNEEILKIIPHAFTGQKFSTSIFSEAELKALITYRGERGFEVLLNEDRPPILLVSTGTKQFDAGRAREISQLGRGAGAWAFSFRASNDRNDVHAHSHPLNRPTKPSPGDERFKEKNKKRMLIVSIIDGDWDVTYALSAGDEWVHVTGPAALEVLRQFHLVASESTGSILRSEMRSDKTEDTLFGLISEKNLSFDMTRRAFLKGATAALLGSFLGNIDPAAPKVESAKQRGQSPFAKGESVHRLIRLSDESASGGLGTLHKADGLASPELGEAQNKGGPESREGKADLTNGQFVNSNSNIFEDSDGIQQVTAGRKEQRQLLVDQINFRAAHSNQNNGRIINSTNSEDLRKIQIHGNQDPALINRPLQNVGISSLGESQIADMNSVKALSSEPISGLGRDGHVEQKFHEETGSSRSSEGLFPARKPGAVADGLTDIIPSEIRVLSEDGLSGFAGSKQVENQMNGDSQSSNTGLASEHLGIGRNASELLHNGPESSTSLKSGQTLLPQQGQKGTVPISGTGSLDSSPGLAPRAKRELGQAAVRRARQIVGGTPSGNTRDELRTEESPLQQRGQSQGQSPLGTGLRDELRSTLDRGRASSRTAPDISARSEVRMILWEKAKNALFDAIEPPGYDPNQEFFRDELRTEESPLRNPAEMIAKAQNFQELFQALERIGNIQGSVRTYSASDLRDRINEQSTNLHILAVARQKQRPRLLKLLSNDGLTNTFGLREKVADLLMQLENDTSSQIDESLRSELRTDETQRVRQILAEITTPKNRVSAREIHAGDFILVKNIFGFHLTQISSTQIQSGTSKERDRLELYSTGIGKKGFFNQLQIVVYPEHYQFQLHEFNPLGFEERVGTEIVPTLEAWRVTQGQSDELMLWGRPYKRTLVMRMKKNELAVYLALQGLQFQRWAADEIEKEVLRYRTTMWGDEFNETQFRKRYREVTSEHYFKALDAILQKYGKLTFEKMARYLFMEHAHHIHMPGDPGTPANPSYAIHSNLITSDMPFGNAYMKWAGQVVSNAHPFPDSMKTYDEVNVKTLFGDADFWQYLKHRDEAMFKRMASLLFNARVNRTTTAAELIQVHFPAAQKVLTSAFDFFRTELRATLGGLRKRTQRGQSQGQSPMGTGLQSIDERPDNLPARLPAGKLAWSPVANRQAGTAPQNVRITSLTGRQARPGPRLTQTEDRSELRNTEFDPKILKATWSETSEKYFPGLKHRELINLEEILREVEWDSIKDVQDFSEAVRPAMAALRAPTGLDTQDFLKAWFLLLMDRGFFRLSKMQVDHETVKRKAREIAVKLEAPIRDLSRELSKTNPDLDIIQKSFTDIKNIRETLKWTSKLETGSIEDRVVASTIEHFLGQTLTPLATYHQLLPSFKGNAKVIQTAQQELSLEKHIRQLSILPKFFKDLPAPEIAPLQPQDPQKQFIEQGVLNLEPLILKALRDERGTWIAIPVNEAVYPKNLSVFHAVSDVTMTIALEQTPDDHLLELLTKNNRLFPRDLNKRAFLQLKDLARTRHAAYKKAYAAGDFITTGSEWAAFYRILSGGYLMDLDIEGQTVEYLVPEITAFELADLVKKHELLPEFFLALKETKERLGLSLRSRTRLIFVTRSEESITTAFFKRPDIQATLARFGIEEVQIIGTKIEIDRRVVSPKFTEKGLTDYKIHYAPFDKAKEYVFEDEIYFGDDREVADLESRGANFINVEALGRIRKADAEAYFTLMTGELIKAVESSKERGERLNRQELRQANLLYPQINDPFVSDGASADLEAPQKLKNPREASPLQTERLLYPSAYLSSSVDRVNADGVSSFALQNNTRYLLSSLLQSILPKLHPLIISPFLKVKSTSQEQILTQREEIQQDASSNVGLQTDPRPQPRQTRSLNNQEGFSRPLPGDWVQTFGLSSFHLMEGILTLVSSIIKYFIHNIQNIAVLALVISFAGIQGLGQEVIPQKQELEIERMDLQKRPGPNNQTFEIKIVPPFELNQEIIAPVNLQPPRQELLMELSGLDNNEMFGKGRNIFSRGALKELTKKYQAELNQSKDYEAPVWKIIWLGSGLIDEFILQPSETSPRTLEMEWREFDSQRKMASYKNLSVKEAQLRLDLTEARIIRTGWGFTRQTISQGPSRFSNLVGKFWSDQQSQLRYWHAQQNVRWAESRLQAYQNGDMDPNTQVWIFAAVTLLAAGSFPAYRFLKSRPRSEFRSLEWLKKLIRLVQGKPKTAERLPSQSTYQHIEMRLVKTDDEINQIHGFRNKGRTFWGSGSQAQGIMESVKDHLGSMNPPRALPFSRDLKNANVLIVGMGRFGKEIEAFLTQFPDIASLHLVDLDDQAFKDLEKKLENLKLTHPPKIYGYRTTILDPELFSDALGIQGKIDFLFQSNTLLSSFFDPIHIKQLQSMIQGLLKERGIYFSVAQTRDIFRFEDMKLLQIFVNWPGVQFYQKILPSTERTELRLLNWTTEIRGLSPEAEVKAGDSSVALLPQNDKTFAFLSGSIKNFLMAGFLAASIMVAQAAQMTREQIIKVQSKLTELGVYQGPRNGKLGPLTKAGIGKAQELVKVNPDKKWGPVTERAVDAHLAAKRAQTKIASTAQPQKILVTADSDETDSNEITINKVAVKPPVAIQSAARLVVSKSAESQKTKAKKTLSASDQKVIKDLGLTNHWEAYRELSEGWEYGKLLWPEAEKRDYVTFGITAAALGEELVLGETDNEKDAEGFLTGVMMNESGPELRAERQEGMNGNRGAFTKFMIELVPALDAIRFSGALARKKVMKGLHPEKAKFVQDVVSGKAVNPESTMKKYLMEDKDFEKRVVALYFEWKLRKLGLPKFGQIEEARAFYRYAWAAGVTEDTRIAGMFLRAYATFELLEKIERGETISNQDFRRYQEASDIQKRMSDIAIPMRIAHNAMRLHQDKKTASAHMAKAQNRLKDFEKFAQKSKNPYLPYLLQTAQTEFTLRMKRFEKGLPMQNRKEDQPTANDIRSLQDVLVVQNRNELRSIEDMINPDVAASNNPSQIAWATWEVLVKMIRSKFKGDEMTVLTYLKKMRDRQPFENFEVMFAIHSALESIRLQLHPEIFPELSSLVGRIIEEVSLPKEDIQPAVPAERSMPSPSLKTPLNQLDRNTAKNLLTILVAAVFQHDRARANQILEEMGELKKDVQLDLIDQINFYTIWENLGLPDSLEPILREEIVSRVHENRQVDHRNELWQTRDGLKQYVATLKETPFYAFSIKMMQGGTMDQMWNAAAFLVQAPRGVYLSAQDRGDIFKDIERLKTQIEINTDENAPKNIELDQLHRTLEILFKAYQDYREAFDSYEYTILVPRVNLGLAGRRAEARQGTSQGTSVESRKSSAEGRISAIKSLDGSAHAVWRKVSPLRSKPFATTEQGRHDKDFIAPLRDELRSSFDEDEEEETAEAEREAEKRLDELRERQMELTKRKTVDPITQNKREQVRAALKQLRKAGSRAEARQKPSIGVTEYGSNREAKVTNTENETAEQRDNDGANARLFSVSPSRRHTDTPVSRYPDPLLSMSALDTALITTAWSMAPSNLRREFSQEELERSAPLLLEFTAREGLEALKAKLLETMDILIAEWERLGLKTEAANLEFFKQKIAEAVRAMAEKAGDQKVLIGVELPTGNLEDLGEDLDLLLETFGPVLKNMVFTSGAEDRIQLGKYSSWMRQRFGAPVLDSRLKNALSLMKQEDQENLGIVALSSEDLIGPLVDKMAGNPNLIAITHQTYQAGEDLMERQLMLLLKTLRAVAIALDQDLNAELLKAYGLEAFFDTAGSSISGRRNVIALSFARIRAELHAQHAFSASA